MYVIDAPIRADRAFVLRLPGLIECFHDVVHVALGARTFEEATQEQRLIARRCDRCAARSTFGRPAHFQDHDRLVRERSLQQLHLRDHEVDRGIDVDALPVRQQMHSDEIHMLGELGMREPHMPGLGGTDRLTNLRARPVQIGGELCRRQIAAQDRLVTDDHADDVRMTTREIDRGLCFLVVCFPIAIQPRTDGHAHVVSSGDIGYLAK